MSKYVGQVSISHHCLSVAEFKRLEPVMSSSRIVTNAKSPVNNPYHEGHLDIINEEGIQISITLFSVKISEDMEE